LEITAKLGPGDPYTQINNVVEINSKKEVSIVHKSGQVFLIDFWATWCPPCQAPMAHNQKMLEAHGDEWKDKVRIIGVSIDQTADAVVKHVKAKGWEKVEHYHKHGSSADEDYGVQGVPHVVIIDGNGMIAYAGHPASRNIEEDLKTLAKGEKLKGVSSGGDDDEEEDDGSAFKDTDLADV
jgi:thiol-disulfide isomerase/thioredoxin